MSEPNNILPLDAGHNKLSEEKLMLYLEGKLTAEQQHEVELWLAEEGMESDAVEGLQTIKADEARHTVNRLNHGLRKSLVSKRRKPRPLKNDFNVIITLVIILLLAIVAYIVVRKSI